MKIEEVIAGKKCFHYKHPEKIYIILGIARQTENLAELVIYQAQYHSEEWGNNAIWARPKEMFLGTVIVDGKEIDRFTAVK